MFICTYGVTDCWCVLTIIYYSVLKPTLFRVGISLWLQGKCISNNLSYSFEDLHFTFFCLTIPFIFSNWTIIALQCCVGFYRATMQRSHNYIYILSLLSLSHPSHWICILNITLHISENVTCYINYWNSVLIGYFSSAAAVKNQIILLLLLFHLSFIINQSIWYFLKEEMQFEIYMTFKSL